ncbi:hypothetical protein [Pseudomonas sp. MWU13-2105]|uniref:hypothetical protein n=1 Tax=Pseudomonas sp. MWU13-2105 TaxID=2935074 RepID=UPI0020104229|nr:hypothetical protein [Pseudomonas sp. MWU13-2105]
MSKSKRNSRQDEPQELPIPKPLGVVPPIAGGEENLVHTRDLTRPLKIQIDQWNNWAPQEGRYDEVILFWDGAPLGALTRLEGPGPFSDVQRQLEVPAEKLVEGIHALYYTVKIWSATTPAESFPANVTIDTTKPRLNQAEDKLIFPAEILNDGVTAAYLAANNDQVKATIPRYDENTTGPKPGDIITWYLNIRSGTGEPDQLRVDSMTVPYPVPALLEVVYPGQAFVDFGDREGYARYRVEDRAGNISELSARVDLDVKATPTPRDLTYARVNEATGSPQASQLDPNPPGVVLSGVIVTIPQNALISDGETAAVLFGEPGSFGFYRAETPITAGGREYRIPRDYIARNVRKMIPVSFAVTVPGLPDPLPSAVHNLSISSLTNLPTIQCDKVSGSGGSAVLRLSQINDGGVATFTQMSWKYMATWQFFRVTVRGVLITGGQETVTVLDAGPVPASGTVQGGTISKTALQRFLRGESLDIRSYASFDNKANWYDFPYMTPTLVD